jgi:hypothetical protein
MKIEQFRSIGAVSVSPSAQNVAVTHWQNYGKGPWNWATHTRIGGHWKLPVTYTIDRPIRSIAWTTDNELVMVAWVGTHTNREKCYCDSTMGTSQK